MIAKRTFLLKASTYLLLLYHGAAICLPHICLFRKVFQFIFKYFILKQIQAVLFINYINSEHYNIRVHSFKKKLSSLPLCFKVDVIQTRLETFISAARYNQDSNKMRFFK